MKREVARNKAKSAVLAVMCVVALCFWGPLIFNWTGLGSPSHGVNASESPLPLAGGPAVGAVLSPETPMVAKAKSATSWLSLITAIEADPMMASGSAISTDPFRSPTVATPVVAQDVHDTVPAEETKTTLAMLSNDPKQLGIRLESVFVGRRNRVARISGHSFRENSRIYLSGTGAVLDISKTSSGSPSELSLEIAAVNTDHVVLSDGTSTFTLPLHRPTFGFADQTTFER